MADRNQHVSIVYGADPETIRAPIYDRLRLPDEPFPVVVDIFDRPGLGGRLLFGLHLSVEAAMKLSAELAREIANEIGRESDE